MAAGDGPPATKPVTSIRSLLNPVYFQKAVLMTKHSTTIVRCQARLIKEGAKLPEKTRDTDAGYDIYSIVDIDLVPGKATTVNTGVQVSAPPGWYYTIEGRSSLALKKILPIRPIVDATYTGELIVMLVNVGESSYHIKRGDRIAQLIFHRQYDTEFEIVDEFSDDYNQRGTKGFGSTGQ